MSRMYDTIPPGAQLELTPFEVRHPEQQLKDFKTLLSLTPTAPPTYENTTRLDGQYGVSRDWTIRMRDLWLNNYDWRKTESRINSFPNYTAPIKGRDGETYTTHFVALWSEKKDAIPVVLIHGWPGSFLEFLPLLQEAQNRWSPAELPYHFIVPSITGYAYSSGPSVKTEWNHEDMTFIINELMVGLGFGSGYVSQGGDLGSFISRILAARYDACKAIHLNFSIMREPEGIDPAEISDVEKQGLARIHDFVTYGNAYGKEHGTKGATIGLVLASNPLALLCWIGEKYIAWSDETPKDEDILDSVMLYWLTATLPRGIYPYIDHFGRGDKNISFHGSAEFRSTKPLAYSYFPFEIAVPVAWVQKTGNLVFSRIHESGGHFAALEKPKELLDDVQEFVNKLDWGSLVTK